MELYADFLKKVMHDEFESKRMHDKVDLLKKNKSIKQDGREDRTSELENNTNSLIIVISGNQDTIGKIVSVGYEIKALLRYNPKEVVG